MIAERLGCNTYALEDGNIDLGKQELIMFVVSNVGDEELPQQTENFLCNLGLRNKEYMVCELGNYLGLENYCGCKQVLIKLLNKLGWHKVADTSIDSMPSLDLIALNTWIESCIHYIAR